MPVDGPALSQKIGLSTAGKTGITYVDVWDGFVDEAGCFLQKGPDFEGQIRQLRSYDGVYFTKPGARKLAHYVEREITRLLAARSAPIALPTEPATPDANAMPGQPAPRPLAGPIVPLVASSVGTDQLLGGLGRRQRAIFLEFHFPCFRSYPEHTGSKTFRPSPMLRPNEEGQIRQQPIDCDATGARRNGHA
jgi:hypothetical protein